MEKKTFNLLILGMLVVLIIVAVFSWITITKQKEKEKQLKDTVDEIQNSLIDVDKKVTPTPKLKQ